MAAVALGVSAPFATTNAASYTTNSFTPTANDLLVAICAVTGQAATDWTVTDSLGGSWTKILRKVKELSADIMEVWVRNALAPASSLTVTYSHATGNATGGGLVVMRVSGMRRVGAPAVRSQGGEDNIISPGTGTPVPTLSQAALTGNPTISAVLNATNPAGAAVPTNWTDRANLGYNSPTSGIRVISRDSGFTGTTITWGGASASNYCSVAIELNTDVGPELWLKADSLALADNDPVGSWPDSSPYAHDASQATAGKKPLFKTGISPTRQPGVLFDGSDDFMTAAGMPSIPFGNSTWFIVYRSEGASGSGAYGGLLVDPPSLHGLWDRRAVGALDYADATDRYSTTFVDNGVVRTYSAVATDGALAVFLNGNADGTFSALTGVYAAGAWILGADNVAIARDQFLGYIFEIRGYPYAMTAAERQAIEQALIEKWEGVLRRPPRVVSQAVQRAAVR